MRLINIHNKRILAWQVQEAITFVEKMKELLFSYPLSFGSALHIHSGRSIYPIFHDYCVDILHLDSTQHIIGIEEDVHPGTEGRTYRSAVSVVKLPAGRVRETETKIGQAVQFKLMEEQSYVMQSI